MAKGVQQGVSEGRQEAITMMVGRLLKSGMTEVEISCKLAISINQIKEAQNKIYKIKDIK